MINYWESRKKCDFLYGVAILSASSEAVYKAHDIRRKKRKTKRTSNKLTILL